MEAIALLLSYLLNPKYNAKFNYHSCYSEAFIILAQKDISIEFILLLLHLMTGLYLHLQVIHVMSPGCEHGNINMRNSLYQG